MRYYIRTVWGALLVLSLLLLPACEERTPEKVRASLPENAHPTAPGQSPAGRTVLLVHSYHPEYPWGQAIDRGVTAALADSGVRLEVFYMDTKRKTSELWKTRAGELAAAKLDECKADVVITADDNAQQYFGRHYVGKTPFLVFCGVNADPAKYGYPASNVTGIIERPQFRDTIRFLQTIRPVKKVAILASNDPTAVGAINFMKEDYVDVEVVEWKLISDFDEWQDTVKRYNTTVDAFGIYTYHTITGKGSPVSLEPEKVMAWTAQHATVPTFGFADFSIKDGVLLGVVQSAFEHGQLAAEYALEILRGTPLASLPVIKAQVGIKMVNLDTAQRLGIPLSDELRRYDCTATGD